MAEEQSKGIQQIEGCEVIYDMGSGLVIAKVPLDKVKEQDINARIMKNEMQDQLTANIKKRGQLESLPLFVLVDGKLEINEEEAPAIRTIYEQYVTTDRYCRCVRSLTKQDCGKAAGTQCNFRFRRRQYVERNREDDRRCGRYD